MIYKIKQEKYEVCFEVKEGNAFISSGTFGDVSILKSSLFSARIKQVQNCETRYITSCSERFDISVEHYCKYIKFYISFPGELSGILVVLTGNIDELGISWSSNVINDNADWTVMEVTYPVPKFTAERFDLFVPSSCGRVIENAGKREYNYHANYPSHTACMQYFAAYGNMGGLYLGIHDGKGATKNFDVTISGGKVAITCLFYGIGAGRGANLFALYGSLRWQFLNGDWYDASMIYASFVKRDAGWLPAIGEKGRFDTADQYKSIPFWIMDYIPNSEEQGDNKPESLSAGGDQYSDDYWYKAAIELKDALKTPIAYHVYNWHKIPFNINYPHFNPAKPSYYEGQEALKKHKIYIMPYIMR